MIHVKQDQQNYQRLVWRSNSNEKLKGYVPVIVTFGTTPAVFQVIRVVL